MKYKTQKLSLHWKNNEKCSTRFLRVFIFRIDVIAYFLFQLYKIFHNYEYS